MLETQNSSRAMPNSFDGVNEFPYTDSPLAIVVARLLCAFNDGIMAALTAGGKRILGVPREPFPPTKKAALGGITT
jgi:hypothetical protein